MFWEKPLFVLISKLCLFSLSFLLFFSFSLLYLQLKTKLSSFLFLSFFFFFLFTSSHFLCLYHFYCNFLIETYISAFVIFQHFFFLNSKFWNVFIISNWRYTFKNYLQNVSINQCYIRFYFNFKIIFTSFKCKYIFIVNYEFKKKKKNLRRWILACWTLVDSNTKEKKNQFDIVKIKRMLSVF